MDRKEIKDKAKEKIKGHIWEILWPALVIGILYYVILRVFVVNVTSFSAANNSINTATSIKEFIMEVLFSIAVGGYIKYLIDFVRIGKTETKTILDTIKVKWLNLLVANILVELIIIVGMMLFVIPGIIAVIGLSFVNYIIVDSNESGTGAIKKSWEMMKGYKWDLFVFSMSFLGWIFLSLLTFGILFIWVAPYMSVASILYYEKLKELK